MNKEKLENTKKTTFITKEIDSLKEVIINNQKSLDREKNIFAETIKMDLGPRIKNDLKPNKIRNFLLKRIELRILSKNQ